MNFSEAIQGSKSGRNALNAFNRMQLSAEGLPNANELDNATTQEEKIFKRMASTILRLADANWWTSAPKMQGSHKLIGTLQGLADHGYTIEILSSPFGEASKEGKLKWCRNNLPEEFSEYHIRSDKESLASSTTLLIDDREKVCRKFSEAGGHTVLFDEDWLLSLKEVFKNNNISTVYCDLDGVLVDTRKHIVKVLENL